MTISRRPTWPWSAAGLVGASVAYELACAGASVALIDASLPGRASDAGAGIISPETFHEPDRQWFDFGTDAGRHLRTLVARLADDGADPGPDAFAECGSLVVALAEHEDPWFSRGPGRWSRARDARRRRDPRRRAPAPCSRRWAGCGGPCYSPSAARVDGRALRARCGVAAEGRGVTVGGDGGDRGRSPRRPGRRRCAASTMSCPAARWCWPGGVVGASHGRGSATELPGDAHQGPDRPRRAARTPTSPVPTGAPTAAGGRSCSRS